MNRHGRRKRNAIARKTGSKIKFSFRGQLAADIMKLQDAGENDKIKSMMHNFLHKKLPKDSKYLRFPHNGKLIVGYVEDYGSSAEWSDELLTEVCN